MVRTPLVKDAQDTPVRILLYVFFFCLLLPTSVTAGHKETSDHIVYFTSIDSRLVPPMVARSHGLPRGPRYLTVSVTVHTTASAKAVAAQITGHTTNLLAQQVSLEFKEVREQDALYYLATHTADQKDTHRYRLVVQPLDEQGAGKATDPIHVTFDYRFFSGDETISREISF